MESVNKQPDERSVYIWNITGSLSNALLSVIVLMVVTRTVDEQQADIFSIAWTISQLMATIGTYQIRNYQATDVREKYSFYQYGIFRIITVVIMMACSAIYVCARGYSGYKAAVILIICLFRAMDSVADVYEGWFQQRERLDLAGKALTFRVIFAMISFTLSLLITKNLLTACCVIFFVYAVCFLLYDVRYQMCFDVLKDKKKREKGLAWIIRLGYAGFPLFVNGYIMMDITNAPKMAIDSSIAQGMMEHGAQTVYNVLFMPASILTLAYIVFRPLLTKLALAWHQKQTGKFVHILLYISASLAGLAVLALAGGALLGIQVLSVVYALDLGGYRVHLLIIIAGGCLYTFSAVLDNALVVIRKQYILILSYLLTWVYIKSTASVFVGKAGMLGAAVSYASSMLVFLTVTFLIFIISFNKEKKLIENGGKNEERGEE